MAKKYEIGRKSAAENLSVKEGASPVLAKPRYATPEMMEKALAKVMLTHGEALRKLAQ